MSYLVLARKYRPQTFEDLVGQDHVARTLASAIATGRIAHAFLFTGVRGVGKTTSARLLAKCLNCVGPPDHAAARAPGPTSSPCNRCGPCTEITAGQDLDVQEIDGASYNGVDEVRRLQEGMTFRPARDRFKIYIVDEVHMLSTAAWNAFLKTLEEPPPHVKFIFATTEVHKVPVTILSRCQRYDFKLIPTQTIASRLGQVLGQEHIDADAPAVQVLAREAAGSMRDAMSLLDQVIAFSGNKLTGEDVARVLGVADRAVLHELATALVGGNPAACLAVVDRLAQQGFDLAHVTKDILRHLRNLVVAKECDKQTGTEGPPLRELLDLADEEMGDVVALAARTDADDSSRLFQGFSRSYDEIVRSGHPRMSLEMALVRLARRPPLLPLDELLARVGELEKRLGGAPPQSPLPRGGGGGAGSRGMHASAAADGPTGQVPGRGQHVMASPGRGGETVATRGSLALSTTPSAAAPVSSRAVALASSPALVPSPVRVAPPAAAPAAAPAVTPAASATSAAVATAVATAPAVAPDGDWRAILERLRVSRPALASVFEHALPLEIGRERVRVGFEPSDAFLAARASEPESLEALTREVRAHFGAPTQVGLDLSPRQGTEPGRRARQAAPVRSVASQDAERRSAEAAEARARVEAHPVVQEVVRLFGAQLRDVKLPTGEA